ncbi:hypothetical protein [Kitasatospora sp. NPDC088548]|uniref:hypothetical protein n=1 Tax=Kitasatospora sp. NPDC088548 TaxID=3364075 RepID=UPI003806E9B8
MTTDEPRDLTEQLIALADQPAPPTALDTAWAIVQGRARLRRRRRAAVGAAAAATVVALAASLLLQAPGGAPAPAVPVVSPSPPMTYLGADPLTTEVRFGWLPDWVGGRTGISYNPPDAEIIGPSDADGHIAARGKGSDAPQILLSLYPAGSEPVERDPGGWPLAEEEAPPVNGKKAYWALPRSDREPNAVMLRWLTPSGRWAEITAHGGRPEDVSRDVLHRVAADVRYGHWDVPLPLRITDLPGVVKVAEARLLRSDPGTDDWSFDLVLRVDGRTLAVTLRPDVPGPSPTPTTPGSYGRYVPLCSVDRGVRVCAQMTEDPPPSLERLGGVPAVLDRIQALGLDDSAWVTDVLR